MAMAEEAVEESFGRVLNGKFGLLMVKGVECLSLSRVRVSYGRGEPSMILSTRDDQNRV